MSAVALLLGHELGIIDGGVYFLQAVTHIALEAGWNVRVIEGVADAGGKWVTSRRDIFPPILKIAHQAQRA